MGSGSSRASVKKLDPSKPPPIPKADSATDNALVRKPRSADLSFFGRRKNRPESGASAATVGAVNIRGKSATSNRSADSGIGSYNRKSPDRRDGSATSSKNAAVSRANPSKLLLENPNPPARADEKKILGSLREEGLLTAPETKTATAGLCYEVPLGELQKAKTSRPPARLQKLERQHQLELSKQQIKDKLEKAERRRKRREREKIERSREKDAKNLEVKLALLEIEKSKEKELRRQVDSKLQTVATRKSSQIEQIVQKQKEHELKVDDVRARKESSPRQAFLDPKELDMMQPKPSPRNIDMLPVAAARKK